MASSITFTPKEIAPKYYAHGNILSLSIVWDCGAAAHADFDEDFDTDAMDAIKCWKCVSAVTIPGNHAKCAGTAPTANYDIEILDEYDVDIFGGLLNDRSATESEQQVPKIGDGLGARVCAGQWTFILTGNLVDDANGKVILYFEI
jgi:hypothetical protein